MKVGSIVECIPFGPHDDIVIPLTIGAHYTVREIRKSPFTLDPTLQILLEEVINDFSGGFEYGYTIKRFREIEFPPALADEINEALTREFEPVLI